MKKFLILCLCCALALPPNASAYGAYAEDNPFVEAMLRMMELFGLIDRNSLPLGVPYLPGYGRQLAPGLGGFGGVPGMSPISGLGGVPGMSPLYGMGGFPAAGAMPGAGGWPGGMPGNWYGQGPATGTARYLDGIWELNNGGFVIIRGDKARLYLSREQYQDFAIRYDRRHLWWKPQQGGAPSRYLYQMREGRMILRDEEGNLLLLRRRR